MGGTGPAPKNPEQRRNANPKLRGEWVEIQPRIGSDFPLCPVENPRTVQAWAAWWRDPASSQWTDADVDALGDLAALHAQFAEGKLGLAPEIRLRSDGLGLTQKGKRDLRWKVAEPDELKKPKAKTPGLRKLKAV